MKPTKLALYRKKAEKVQFWIQFLALLLAFATQLSELVQFITSLLNQ